MLCVSVSHVYPADLETELASNGHNLLMSTGQAQPAQGEQVGIFSSVTGYVLALGTVAQFLEGAFIIKANKYYV
jgi:hypothetical protein